MAGAQLGDGTEHGIDGCCVLIESIERVYLHRAPVDVRKQIEGLVMLANDVMHQDPTSGALFAFVNAKRNKLKLLMWERNGCVFRTNLTADSV
jgi:transposase